MDPVLAAVLIIVAALLLFHAGLLAATDAALNVRSRAELYRLAEGSSRQARAIRAIADDEVAHLHSIAFARVTAESFAAVLITVVLMAKFENIWLVLGLSVAAVMLSTFVLVGASPRRLGITYPNRTIRFTAQLVSLLRIVLGPLAASLLRINTVVLERGAAHSEGESEQDNQLLSLVDRAAEHDVLKAEDREYIHSLLKFGQTLVREPMVPRTDMKTLEHTVNMRVALESLLANRVSRMPVIADDADDVLGVIHLRDAAGFVLRYPDEADTAPVTRMMRQALFVPELMRADALLEQMQHDNNHLALTVDEYGGISGLVTMEDLIEQLVGDIYDEHDREDEYYTANPDGSFTVSPRLLVSELGELFEIELSDDDIDTAAGLFVKELGRLAEKGDRVLVAGIELSALKVNRRGAVLSLLARWVGDEQAAAAYPPAVNVADQ